MIYKASRSPNSAIATLEQSAYLRDRFEAAAGIPLLPSWTPLAVTIELENMGDPLEPVDLHMGGGTPALVFNQKARGALGYLLEANGEVLPLQRSSGVGFLASIGARDMFLHRTQVIDCLDQARSEIERLPVSGAIFRIRRPVLNVDSLDGMAMFVLPEVFGTLLVTQVFVDRVRETGLKGLTFRPYFDDRLGQQAHQQMA